MADKTLFEKICDKEIPAAIVFEDECCVAFRDIAPQAPTHILIVPRRPIPRVGLTDAESGFRLVINNGPHGGEAVPHLHIHLLGGRQLQWPPG
jgi:histidine triad (HIT) family protein